MGLTERHWFEDEESELTENQLEDILWENNKIFERGYQKGFSDGKSAILREQEPVEPNTSCDGVPGEGGTWWYVCGNCSNAIDPDDAYCRHCGRAVKWEVTGNDQP